MAQKSGFFDTTADDPRQYPAREFAEYFARFIGNGIFAGGTNLKVSASGTDSNVSIDLGYAWINGYLYSVFGEPLVIPITAATTQDRIDRIVLRLDVSTPVRSIKAVVLQGNPSPSPTPPSLIRSGDIYDLSLAQVRMIANTAIIEPHQVTDERLNNAVCGIVTGVVEQADTTDIFNEFHSWMISRQTAYAQQWNAWLSNATNQYEGEWTAWFGTTQDEWQQWFDDIESQTPVFSVNGKGGIVVLTAEDVGAAKASDLANHVADKSNPHGVTKSQIGLGNVDNLSAADIRSGTTKTNVGLGNVQNYGVATKAQAEAGTANNLYMTPLRTKEAILANNVPTRIHDGVFQYFNGSEWVDVGCKFDKSAMTPISIDNKVITNSSGYTTVLDVNGKGYMDVITMGHMHSSSDAPAYLKVTVDGVVVLEAMTMSTSNSPVVGCISRNFLMSIASNGAGVYHPSTSVDNIRISSNFRVVDAPFVYSDSTDYGGVIIYPDSLYFNTSLKVEISSRFSRGDVAYTISGGVME